ncbi:hypothetical protein REPUB_Repub05bG0046700 [Reevesia pubescens]
MVLPGKRYLGIWYKKSVQTVVWVANREVPLNDSSGVAKVTNQGILVLLSGNLVVKDEKGKSFIWQSFDHPCDTLLPSMKIGKDLVIGLYLHPSSWKGSDDPAAGNFTFGLDINGFPVSVLKEGSMVRFRSGPWNRLQFSGMPELRSSPTFRNDFDYNEKELAQEDTCDNYGLFGAYGFCDVNNSPVCTCLDGFVPKNKKEWDKEPGSGGCIRKTPFNCSGDGFVEVSGVKLPDSRQSPVNNTMNLEECKIQCSKNCSCTAYANLDIRELVPAMVR